MRLLTPIHSLSLFFSRLALGCHVWLLRKRGRSILIGEKSTFFGKPILHLARNTHLQLGAGGIYRSAPRSNILGLVHPVVLATLKSGAELIVGDEVGISDTNSIDANAAPVTIGQSVFIGTGCLILKGVTIGASSVVGAGSVVRQSIPSGVIATENPCVVIKRLH